MNELPNGWAEVTLQDVAIWSSGGTPSRANPAYYKGEIPWFKTGELGPHVLYSAEEHISQAAVDASSAKLFAKGSVALAMYGATIGKTSIFGIDAATNQACAVGAPDAVSAEFLYHFLVSQEKFFCEAGKGGAQPNISQGIVKSWPFLLPPSAEQTRILEKLEELLTVLDAGVAELKAAQKKLAQYRQSLLKAAVEGALTAEWRAKNPPTETGAQLLERILQERRARWEAKQLAKFKEQGKAPPKDWQKKYAEPVQPDANDLLELPHGWVRGSFDQLFEVLSDNGKKLSQAAYAQAGLLPVIDQGAKFIGGYTDDVSLSFDGALPVIGFGDHTRRFKLIENPFVVGADGLKLISISSAWIPEFAFIACSTLDLEDRGYSRHFQFVRNASFPLPPLGEQSEIVVSVAARLKENDDISEAIELALKQSAAQRQNILKAAFSGQLVAQDPSDEPARELLERIRAERATQQAIKKPRGRKAKEAA